MNELQTIVEEMRVQAREHIFDIVAVADGGEYPDCKPLTRDIDYRSYKIRLTLTVDDIGKRKIWHLSVGPLIPNGIVNTIVEAFMPGKRMEMPSVLHPGYVRQFIQPFEEEEAL